MKVDPEMELYWYAFSFSHLSATRRQIASCYVGYASKRVTLANIAKAKVTAKVPPDAVLMACSYLGRMTTEEFTGKETEQ